MKLVLTLSLLILLLVGCDQTPPQSVPDVIANSTIDAKAVAIANKAMAAMGGQQAWEALHYVSWTFFGARDLIWDKWGSRVRIDSPRDSSVYVLDMSTGKGKAWKGGIEITEADSLNILLEKAKGIWINDSYWLVMPFKLQDPGVNLKYMRTDTTLVGASSDVLELTFNEVGNTPDNKYEVYVEKSTNLVKQWAFFRDAKQTTPPAIWPWDNYKDYNGLKISSDRSDKRGPSNVKVHTELPETVFNALEKPSL